jgi:hypothetical protein
MSDVSLRLPFEIGQPVRHRSDPARAAGVVVGIILNEPVRALVDWRAAAATFEALDDLVTGPQRSLGDAA